ARGIDRKTREVHPEAQPDRPGPIEARHVEGRAQRGDIQAGDQRIQNTLQLAGQEVLDLVLDNAANHIFNEPADNIIEPAGQSVDRCVNPPRSDLNAIRAQCNRGASAAQRERDVEVAGERVDLQVAADVRKRVDVQFNLKIPNDGAQVESVLDQ